ncbi:MAG: PIN domain-containing protein, partial [Gemmataceae bacterium]
AIHGRAQGFLRAKWTGRIHRLRERPELRQALLRTRRLMDEHVRGCRVRNYRRWERRIDLPDENDRHVLAAALACVADFIVTFNTRDFPAETLARFGIAAVTPDAFAVGLLPTGIVEAAARDQTASYRNPAITVDEFLEPLRRNSLPVLADTIRRQQHSD